MKQYNVRAIFSGHYHRNTYGKAGNVEMITSGPVGRPLGKDPSGFRVVKVYQDRLEHKYYSLDTVPTQIQLTSTQRTTPTVSGTNADRVATLPRPSKPRLAAEIFSSRLQRRITTSASTAAANPSPR